MADERLLSVQGVAEQVGLSKSEIYDRVAERTFPAPIKLAPKATRWLQSEVQAWIAQQVATCRQARRSA